MLLLAYHLPMDYKMDRVTFYQYIYKEIELLYDQIAPGSIVQSRRRGVLYPESYLRSIQIWYFSFSFTRTLDNFYHISYNYDRFNELFHYTIWVLNQNLQYEITRVEQVGLMHCMEGLILLLPVLIDNVPPDPPLDPEQNKP